MLENDLKNRGPSSIRLKKQFTEKVLLKIHKLVTDKTLDKESSGHYRKGPVYVVRRRLGLPNEIMYTGPDAKKVPELCANLIAWIQESEKQGIDPIIVAPKVEPSELF